MMNCKTSFLKQKEYNENTKSITSLVVKFNENLSLSLACTFLQNDLTCRNAIKCYLANTTTMLFLNNLFLVPWSFSFSVMPSSCCISFKFLGIKYETLILTDCTSQLIL